LNVWYSEDHTVKQMDSRRSSFHVFVLVLQMTLGKAHNTRVWLMMAVTDSHSVSCRLIVWPLEIDHMSWV